MAVNLVKQPVITTKLTVGRLEEEIDRAVA
jgi:hypothetical protein